MVAGEQFNCAANASTAKASNPLRDTNSEAARILRSRASALRSAPRIQSFGAAATSLPNAVEIDNKSVLSPRDILGRMSHSYVQLTAFPRTDVMIGNVRGLSTSLPSIDLLGSPYRP